MPPTTPQPPAVRDRRIDFQLDFAGMTIRAYEREVDGVMRKFIGGSGSSTAEDLYGSVIGTECQQKMADKLRTLAADDKALTAWLNHSYKIPEDTLGSFTGAKLAIRTDDETGKEVVDLDIECMITEENPRAIAAFNQTKEGIRHGWSIGAYFLDYKWTSDDPESDDWDDWYLYVTDILLLEISLVGIPANQRAWVRSAEEMKARAVSIAERVATGARADAEHRDLVLRSFAYPEPSELTELAAKLRTRATSGSIVFGRETKSLVQRAAELLERRGDVVAPDDSQTRAEADDVVPDDVMDSVNLALYEIGLAQAHGVCSAAAAHLDAARGFFADLVSDGEGEELSAEALAERAIAIAAKRGIDLTAAPADHSQRAGKPQAYVVFGSVDREVRAADGSTSTQAVPLMISLDDIAEEDLAKLKADFEQSRGAVVTAESDAEQKRLGELTTQCAAEETRLTELRTSVGEQDAVLAERQQSLTEAETAIEAKRSELAEMEQRVAEFAQRRNGRIAPAGGAGGSGSSDREVKPEHYELSYAEQRDAVARVGADPVAGRDKTPTQ
jgi:hypothetical protein